MNIIIYADVVTILPPIRRLATNYPASELAAFFKTYKVAMPNLSATVTLI
ncbi:hypothetical protein G9X26_08135 [Salmonella enterica subsp. enterica serovar Adjame]|nr:hypothetical protein G9X26_08135 [Salmonella enterica subsp. enterica serovar Adjame]